MDTIISILTNKWFIINTIIGILSIEWGLKLFQPLYPKNNEDRERDNKYSPFKRNDLNTINRPMLYIMAPFMICKTIIGWSAIVTCSIFVYIISLSNKRGDPYSGWKLQFVKWSMSFAARISIYVVGGYWIKTK